MNVYRYDTPVDTVHNVEGPVVFLAGPTVRGHQQHLQPSWRFACIEEFGKRGFDGTLIIPEFPDISASDKGKDWIVLWEFTGLTRADCILFWIPRTRELIGLTTNFELGYWLGRCPEKVVYGRPADAYRVGYPDIMWTEDHNQRKARVPKICTTLEDTVNAALDKLRFKKKQRMLAWAVKHDSHGIHYDSLCFLPEGEAPETEQEWVRVTWLDEP